jgi:hypothetical protein
MEPGSPWEPTSLGHYISASQGAKGRQNLCSWLPSGARRAVMTADRTIATSRYGSRLAGFLPVSEAWLGLTFSQSFPYQAL